MENLVGQPIAGNYYLCAMENKFQLILYIIFGIIWVISRIIKNKNKQVDAPGNEPDLQQPKQPQMTFEDLLKEFTGETKQVNEPEVVEEPTYTFEEEEPSDTEIDEIYQESIKQAQQLEETDSSKLRHKVEYKRFEEFDKEEENTFLNELMEDMREEDGLKKAVIYKEILDRKY